MCRVRVTDWTLIMQTDLLDWEIFCLLIMNLTDQSSVELMRKKKGFRHSLTHYQALREALLAEPHHPNIKPGGRHHGTCYVA